MAEYNKPTTEQEFEKNFKQKAIDIPLFIKQIHTGNLTGSAKTIFSANWLGNACGKICPTGVLCEGACVFNHQDVPPIQIGRLQNYATAKAIQNDVLLFKAGTDNGKKVAIIGSGPAGIACACELRTKGFSVDIYEAKAKPTGLTVYGIAAYKITNEEVLEEVDYLQKQLGLNFICNHPIETKAQIEQLENDYDALFLGVGIGSTATLGLPGEDKENVVGAVEFIEEVRMQHHQLNVPEKVVVIGGGNTAMDAASQSARMGAKEVVLAYRRSKERMGAYGFEYDLAISAGVNSLFDAQPLEITGNGKATGVKFTKTKSIDGKLEYIDGSEFIIDCDLVIKATGQAKQTSFLQLINGLELDKRNKIVVNEKNYQTTNPKYFAGGDAVNGGAEVVNAAYEGKVAALGIEEWLFSNS